MVKELFFKALFCKMIFMTCIFKIKTYEYIWLSQKYTWGAIFYWLGLLYAKKKLREEGASPPIIDKWQLPHLLFILSIMAMKLSSLAGDSSKMAAR